MIKAIILDLDGTVYLGDEEVPGAGAFVRRCRDAGIRCLFVTNRSNRPPEAVAEQLRGYGIPCERNDVLTSAQATAQYLRGAGLLTCDQEKPCRSAFLIGEAGLVEAMREEGIRIVTEAEDRPDAVVVSYDRAFTYAKLAMATQWIGAGARFVATNPDRRLKVAGRTLPGTGSLVAAVEAATGVAPEYVGKPERLIFDMALSKIPCRADEALSVGDLLETDIRGSLAAGIPNVLMLTGVSTRADLAKSPIRPTHVCETFAELSALVFP